MPSTIDTEQAQAFWAWFAASELAIRKAYDAGDYESLDDLLSSHLAMFELSWEMGPYALPDYALVVSPAAREHAPRARALVAAAPKVPGWCVFAGKPPKDLLSLVFKIDGVEVCADEWRYRMTSYNEGEFVDLELFFTPRTAPPGAKADVVCKLIIEALVGELVSLERVGYVTSSLVQDVSVVPNATPIQYLRQHLNEILAPRE